MSRKLLVIGVVGMFIALLSFQNAIAAPKQNNQGNPNWEPGKVLARIQALEQKVQVLEQENQQLVDVDAIKQLKAQFFYYDDAEAIDNIVSLFTDDAVFDLYLDTGYLKFEGKTAIRGFLSGSYSVTDMTRHMNTNPLIEFIDSNTATGKWYLLSTVTYKADYPNLGDPQTAWWGQGTWDDEYVKVNGVWKIKRTTYHANFMVLYSDPNGWVAGP
jgi:bile-acid 7alpha-dehydratase